MKKLIFIIVILVLSNCTEEITTPRAYPRVHTSEVTDIDASRATFHGEITFSNAEIIDHGFFWSESNAPQLNPGKKLSLGSREGKGAFTATLEGVLKEEQTYYVTAFAQSADYIVYGEVVTFMSLGSKAPVLKSISPASAHWGDTITFTGKNFARGNYTSDISFGTLNAKVVSRRDSVLKAIVPEDLLDKKSSVSVSAKGNASTLDGKFELVGQTVTSISPSRGKAGDMVTITGENFNLLHTRVLFGTKEATIVNISRDQIQCTVPASTEGGTINLEVRAGSDFTIVKSFFKETPTITSISPLNATFGDEITIKGEYFDSENKNVTFGSTWAEITFSSATEIRVKVPMTLVAKSNEITLTAGLESIKFNGGIFNLLPPTISSITPAKVSPGENFTIKGSNFNPLGSNLVKMGTTVLWSNTLDANTIEVAMPYYVSTFTLNVTVVTATMSVSADVQCTWARMPTTSPYSFWSWHFVHDGFAYAGVYNGEVWKFNPSSETWTRLKDFPGGSRYQPFSFTVGDKGYLAAGYGDAGWVSELWEYNFSTDQWEQKTDTPFDAPSDPGIEPQGYDGDDEGYVMFMEKLWQYKPSSDSWTQKASFPAYAAGQPLGFAYEGSPYVFGTAQDETGPGSLYRYNSSTNTWEYVTAPPFNYYGQMFSLVFDDAIYIADQNVFDDRSFYKFDPITKSFEKQPPYAAEARLPGVNFVINGVGYLWAGTGWSTSYTDGWKFAP